MDRNETGVFEIHRLAVGSIGLIENTLHLQLKFFHYLLIQM